MWSASSRTVIDDLAEVETTLLDEVLDAAGGADHDVDAALQRADLAALRHAAVDLRGEQADAAGDRLHGAVDLQRELAGRRQDQRARRTAELALAAGLAGLPERMQALDQRRAEGDGLAGAGAAAAEHVLAGEHVGDGRGLDRERRLGTELGERAHDVAAEPEVGEGHALDLACLDGLGLEALEHDVVVLDARGAACSGRSRRGARSSCPSCGGACSSP